jgi:hypothetical protein
LSNACLPSILFALYLKSGHAFPPDVGQGINAGFQDVVALDRALRNVAMMGGDDTDLSSSTKVTTQPATGTRYLGDALQVYERNRRPEHAALIRLTRFGSPYQYRQPWLRHRVGKMLWTMNFLFRVVMNKISMGCIPSAAQIILFSDHSLTYRQVMRRADWTAFGFQFIAWTWLTRWILLRWSLNKMLMFGVSVNAYAACIALLLLKVVIPLQDWMECFLRRER